MAPSGDSETSRRGRWFGATTARSVRRRRRRVKRWLYKHLIAAEYFLRRDEKKQVVFIVTEARSGSTLLDDLMSSVPEVSVAGEVLNPQWRYGIEKSGVDGRQNALRHVRYSANHGSAPVRTIKFLIGQLKLHGIVMEDLRSELPDAKYVVLYREHIFEQYVSYSVAMSTQKWFGRGADSRFDGKIRVNCGEYQRYRERQQQNFDRVLSHKWLAECAEIVTYEQLSACPQQVFDVKLFPFLNLPSTSVRTTVKKQITRPMSEVVENYDEIVKHIDPAVTVNYSLPKL